MSHLPEPQGRELGRPTGLAGSLSGADAETAGQAAAGQAGGEQVCDPVAAAAGNATLLGIGYLLLRRPVLAVGTIVVSGVLVLMVAGSGQPGWPWRLVLLGWWLATVAHAWVRAGGRLRRSEPAPVPVVSVPAEPAQRAELAERARRQRMVAGIAVAVVASVALGVAIDARRLGAAAASAHRGNDCEQAQSILGRIGGHHRVVDAGVAVRARRSAAACDLLLAAHEQAEERPMDAAATLADYLDHRAGLWAGAAELRTDLILRAAAEDFTKALGGPPDTLRPAFLKLDLVLAEAPHRDRDIDRILADYLAGLPRMADPCQGMRHTEQLHGPALPAHLVDRVAPELPEVAPPLLAGCGDQLLDDRPGQARSAYEALRERYPDHPLAQEVLPSIEIADGLIELGHVQGLLRDWPERRGDGWRYCDDPAPWRDAPAYSGPGPHLIVLARGGDGFGDAISPSWHATDYSEATLVLCAGPVSRGEVLGPCFYGQDETVDFIASLHVRVTTIQAYELRTGELVRETTVETRGDCPPYAFRPGEGAPPKQLLSEAVPGPLRAAVEPWVFP